MFTVPAGYHVGDTIPFPFDAYDSNGASVTVTGLSTGDIKVYKNGSTTQRSSSAGFTLLDTDGIDFDGVTGIHGFSIDTSDNTDAGFWVDGATYWVVVDAITIDSQTVRFTYWMTLGMVLRAATAGRKPLINASGHVERVTLTDMLTTYTGNTPQTGDNFPRLGAPAGASHAADIAAVKTDTGNLITRIPAALFSGITSFAQWLGLIAGKQTGDSTARTEIRATGAGSGTYDETTDALQAIRDRGDAAWTTGAGGGSDQPTLLQATTIATLASQTSFTLTAGSADNDAYNDLLAIITDQSTTEQKAVVPIADYVGSTKTITLARAPVFTIAVGDDISIVAEGSPSRTSPINVDVDDTWDFDTNNIVTSGRILTDAIGQAVVLKCMNFDRPLPANSAISSITSVVVSDTVGATEPLVVNSEISGNNRKVDITFNTVSATAASYTVVVTITTTDSQVITRRGRLVLQ